MKLLKPSVEHLDVTSDPLKAIEIAGRTCYKSEDKITDDSAEKFVKMLLDRGHHAMIEHSNIVFTVSPTLYVEVLTVEDRPYIRMTNDRLGHGPLISGNPRAIRDFCIQPYGAPLQVQAAIALAASKVIPLLFEDMLQDHLSGVVPTRSICATKWSNIEDLTVAEKLSHQVASYKIICDRGVTHEIVRHRPFSYAQESTRYVNYKEGVEFIIPCWFDDDKELYLGCDPTPSNYDGSNEHLWCKAMLETESSYVNAVAPDPRCRSDVKPWQAQQARSVLPNSLKTEIVVTGNLQEWRHFFKLRCSAKAHPQMQEVANMVLADMQVRIPGIFDKVTS